jgi:hypothetical protein
MNMFKVFSSTIILLIMSMNEIKCDNCLVKLDSDGFGRFWQLCSDNLNLDESFNKCKVDQMKLSTPEEKYNYNLQSLYRDFSQLNQAHLQAIEIGNIFNETLSVELIYQLNLYDGLFSNLALLSNNLGILESNYFYYFLRNNSDRDIINKLNNYNSSNIEDIYNKFNEIGSKFTESKQAAGNTMGRIISNINSDKRDWSEKIRLSESSQRDQYISNYNNILLNRLRDVDNQVFDIKNKLLDIDNLLLAHKKYFQEQSESRFNSLGVKHVLGNHNALTTYINDYYYLNALNQTRFMRNQVELFNIMFKTRLAKVSSSLRDNFTM